MRPIKEALETAKIVSEVARKDLNKPFRSGGNVYGVDGRMVVRIFADDLYEQKDEKEMRTTESLDSYLKGAYREGINFGIIDADAMHDMLQLYNDMYDNARRTARTLDEERYETCECPVCGETVYFDRDMDMLIDEEPVIEPLEKRDWDGYVVRVNSYDGNHARFDAFFIEQAMKCIPEGRWAIRNGKYGDCENPCLLYRVSYDGDVQVAIMPIIVFNVREKNNFTLTIQKEEKDD